MNHVPGVRGVDGRGDAVHDVQRTRGQQPPGALQLLPQRRALEKLHDEKRAAGSGDADVVHGHHIGVRQRRSQARFRLEPLGRVRPAHEIVAQQFGGHETAEGVVSRRVDRAHASAAHAPLQTVAIAQQPRNRLHAQCGTVARTSAGGIVVTGAALRTILEEIGGAGSRRVARKQQSKAVADGHQQILVLEAVRLFRSFCPEHDQAVDGASIGRTQRHDHLDRRSAQPFQFIG